MASTAIGLDIGTSGVRAAELSFGKGRVTLEKFGQVALPEGAVRDGEVVDGPAVSAAIRQLWSATKFSHKKVVLGVANQRVAVRQIDLPELTPAEMKKSLQFHVQDYLPMPVEQAVLDFHPVQTVEVNGGRQVRGLLVAAQRDVVMANVRAVEAAGLRVTMVDLTSFAVLRAVGTRLDPDVETEALVDIGARVTNIVVHSNGVPLFVRILLMGGQDITDSVAEKLGVPLTEAEGIKQSLGSGRCRRRVRARLPRGRLGDPDLPRRGARLARLLRRLEPRAPRGARRRLRRWLVPARPGRAALQHDALRRRRR